MTLKNYLNGFSLFFLYNGHKTFLSKLWWELSDLMWATPLAESPEYHQETSVSLHSSQGCCGFSLHLPHFSLPSRVFKVSFILCPLLNIFDLHSKSPKVSSMSAFVQQIYIVQLLSSRYYYGTEDESENKKRQNPCCHGAYMVNKCMVMRMHWLLPG